MGASVDSALGNPNYSSPPTLIVGIMEFNLIVVHEPGIDNYRWIRNQIRQVLGPTAVYVWSYQSVILFKVSGDPHEVARELREKLRGSGTPLIKAIPVDAVTNPYIDKVIPVVKELGEKIPEGEPFRITLNGHLYERLEGGGYVRLGSLEAIRRMAEFVRRPVNLSNPSWVIYVRVIKYVGDRRKAAISLLKPEELKRVV